MMTPAWDRILRITRRLGLAAVLMMGGTLEAEEPLALPMVTLPPPATEMPSPPPVTVPPMMISEPAIRQATAATTEGPKGIEAIIPVGCTNCGGGGLITGHDPSSGGGAILSSGGGGLAGCSDCSGCSDGCVPGRKKCASCDATGPFGRFFCALYEATNCPDQCYEPHWVPAANSSFFTDSARPASQFRIRVDSGRNITRPDRAEYFWAAIGQRGPKLAEQRVRYDELSLYTETAVDGFSIWTNTPYRALNANENARASGFADVSIGTKSVLLDSEFVIFSLQMVTTVPAGSAGKGLGNGHVSLEPDFLMTMKLHEDTYLQAQFGEWIPLGGTKTYEGAVLRYSGSINHVISRPTCESSFIASLEFSAMSFQAGKTTIDPNAPNRQFERFEKASDYTYFNVGPGLRFTCSDRLDVGGAMLFATTDQHLFSQLYRFEFRYRY